MNSSECTPPFPHHCVQSFALGLKGGGQVLREGLDGGAVAQVKPNHGQSAAPCMKVWFFSEADGSVSRKARREDQVCPGTKELECDLVNRGGGRGVRGKWKRDTK